MKHIYILLILFSLSFSGIVLRSNYPLRNSNFQQKLSEENMFLVIWALQQLKDVRDIRIGTEGEDTVLYVERYPIVKSVEVEGNWFVGDEEIKNLAGVREDEPLIDFDPEAVQETLRIYYRERGFLNAEVEVRYTVDEQGFAKVRIRVKEGELYFLGGAEFRGAGSFSHSRLLHAAGLRLGEVFDEEKARKGVFGLLDFYRGEGFLESGVYFEGVKKEKGRSFSVLLPGMEAARWSFREGVSALLRGLSNLTAHPLAVLKTLLGRGSLAKPVYTVIEGRRYEVEFRGNRSFSEEELSKLLDLNTPGVDYFFLERSRERIEDFYRGKGFFDVRVSYSYEEGRILFTLKEGERYGVRVLGFRGLKLPDTYDREEIERRVRDFLRRVREEGYLSADIRLLEEVNREKKRVDLLLLYSPGKRVILKDLVYRGDMEEVRALFRKYRALLPLPLSAEILRALNADLKEFFRRRGYLDGDFSVEVVGEERGDSLYLTYLYRVDPGERYTYGELLIYGNEKTHPREIYYTVVKQRFFSTLAEEESLWNLIQSENYTGVRLENLVDREEKKVHRLVEVREDRRGLLELAIGYNTEEKLKVEGGVKLKNLFGVGILGRVRASRSERYRTYEIGLSDRFLFSRKYFGDVSLFRKLEFHESYDLENEGFLISFGYRPRRWYGISLFISRTDNRVSGAEPGSYRLTRGGVFLVREVRDDPINPRNMSHLSLRFSRIEGDRDYYRAELNSFLLRELTRNLSVNLRTAGGWVGEGAPIFDRFFLGGLRDMRGYSFESLGSPLGGRTFLFGRGEVLLRIRGPLWGGLFGDAGSVENSFSETLRKFRYDAGFAFGVSTPAGFIRVDLARPLEDLESPLSGIRVYLSIGYIY